MGHTLFTARKIHTDCHLQLIFQTKALIIVLKPVTIGWSNLPQEIAKYVLCNNILEQK